MVKMLLLQLVDVFLLNKDLECSPKNAPSFEINLAGVYNLQSRNSFLRPKN